MSTGETWLVLGASSAIGRALAREAALRGHAVILAGRDRDDLERTASDIRIAGRAGASVVPWDADDQSGSGALLDAVRQVPGLVNVALLAGIMPDQAAMDADPSLAVACLQTGLVGAVAVLHALAPELERRRGGVVIGFGSVAGDRGRLKNYVYGAAKAGLHAYLSGLRNRLGRSGAHVVTVKPGFVDTAMTFGLPGLFLVASPELVARVVLDSAEKRRDVVYVPWFWWGIMAVIRAVPERVFKKMAI